MTLRGPSVAMARAKLLLVNRRELKPNQRRQCCVAAASRAAGLTKVMEESRNQARLDDVKPGSVALA